MSNSTESIVPDAGDVGAPGETQSKSGGGKGITLGRGPTTCDNVDEDGEDTFRDWVDWVVNKIFKSHTTPKAMRTRFAKEFPAMHNLDGFIGAVFRAALDRIATVSPRRPVSILPSLKNAIPVSEATWGVVCDGLKSKSYHPPDVSKHDPKLVAKLNDALRKHCGEFTPTGLKTVHGCMEIIFKLLSEYLGGREKPVSENGLVRFSISALRNLKSEFPGLKFSVELARPWVDKRGRQCLPVRFMVEDPESDIGLPAMTRVKNGKLLVYLTPEKWIRLGAVNSPGFGKSNRAVFQCTAKLGPNGVSTPHRGTGWPALPPLDQMARRGL